MSITLKNQSIEILIDLPNENYIGTRFNWSGKIIKAKFKETTFGTTEKLGFISQDNYGRGFYNEFGIDSPLGFNETKKGEWFHKIGVGLLKKVEDYYSFARNYELKPCNFSIQKTVDEIQFECISELVNGYAYILTKQIKLVKNGFQINYTLENTGQKTIITDEYCHNFLAIGNQQIGKDYVLKLPFQLNATDFKGNINPNQVVDIHNNTIGFLDEPNEVFFFSHLNGLKKLKAGWKLENTKLNLGIEESGDFLTSKVNLWGCGHVISPELFFEIAIKPNESISWSRSYNFYRLK